MSSIDLILEPDAHGMVHFPVPEELRGASVLVRATVEPVSENRAKRKAGVWGKEGEFWMAPDFGEPLEEFSDLVTCDQKPAAYDVQTLWA